MGAASSSSAPQTAAPPSQTNHNTTTNTPNSNALVDNTPVSVSPSTPSSPAAPATAAAAAAAPVAAVRPPIDWRNVPGPTFFGYNNPMSDELIVQWSVGVAGTMALGEIIMTYTSFGQSPRVQRAFPIWTRRVPIYMVMAIGGWFINRHCIPEPEPIPAIREMRAKQAEEKRLKQEKAAAEAAPGKK